MFKSFFFFIIAFAVIIKFVTLWFDSGFPFYSIPIRFSLGLECLSNQMQLMALTKTWIEWGGSYLLLPGVSRACIHAVCGQA